METFWFLDFLGIDETADRRSIKKSYAKLLKQIDQKEDPEGFAELREAYEIALDWEENNAFYERPEPTDLTSESRRLVETSHIDYSGEALESIIVEWEHDVREIADCAESLHEKFNAVLNQTMRDERLLNFTNRSLFEHYLIDTYRNPDTPLRALSFLETHLYFCWYEHSPYLRESYNGRWVLKVLEEKLLWENQDPDDFKWQEIALNSFLQNKKSKREQKAWQHLIVMARNFPTWFELWIDLDELAAIAEKYSDQVDPSVVQKSSTSLPDSLVIFFIVVIIGNLFSHWNPFYPKSSNQPAQRTTPHKTRSEPLSDISVPKTSEYFKVNKTNYPRCRKLRLFLEIPTNPVDKPTLRTLRRCIDLGFWPPSEKIILDLWEHAEKEKNELLPKALGKPAYVFKLPVTDKECGNAFLFSHTSNWRSIPDLNAKNKFERFIEDCVSEKYWLGGGKEIVAFLVLRINKKKTKMTKTPR